MSDPQLISFQERPKLIAIDLDGTLLNSQKEVSARAKAAIKALSKQGLKIIICTGRPLRSSKHILQELELTELAVLYNGGGVYNLDETRFLHSFALDKDIIQQVIRHMRTIYPDIYVGLERTDGWVIEERRYEELKPLIELYKDHEPIVGDPFMLADHRVMKSHFRQEGLKGCEIASLLSDFPVFCTWHEGLLEVLAPQVSKRYALEHVIKDLGLSSSEVAAFGDEHNDLQMLSWAGLGIAMGNANPEAKAVADKVTLSNDEDGVAVVL